MIKEEFQRDKIKGRAAWRLRAWSYKKKLGEGKGGELARLCWMELRQRAKERRIKGEWKGKKGIL